MTNLNPRNPLHWIVAAYRIAMTRWSIALLHKCMKRPVRGNFTWTDNERVKFSPTRNGLFIVSDFDKNSKISLDLQRHYPLTFNECFKPE